MKGDENDPFDRIYSAQEKKESWARKYGGRIAGGIACSTIVAVVMNIGAVKAVILWGCQIVLMVFGRPPGEEKIGAMKHKVEVAVDKGRDILKDHSDHPVDAVAIPKILPLKKLADAKEDMETFSTGAAAVAGGVRKVEEKVEAVGEKIAVAATAGVGAVAAVPKAVGGFFEKRAEKKEEDTREKLEAHAKVIGLKTDPDWNLSELRAEVIKHELEWQAKHGPNARCPTQRCRYTTRVNPKRRENRMCPLCHKPFTTGSALAAWKAGHSQNIHLFGK